MKKLRKQRQNWIDDFGMDILKRNTPFICFLGLLDLLYIANTHSAENKVNKILALKTEIRELNWEYLKLKSELVHNSMYSTVESKLSVQELGLRGQKPVQVIVKD
ncbi:MAG: FtsL-like putative cell division protein [Saprospiraceae bacterium]|nr:MAG: FtsL-like putative cell division protein [Saprospiraceae bacterium]